MKKISCFLFLCVLACLLVTSHAHADILYGHGNWYQDSILVRIDTVAQSATLVGSDSMRLGPDIEMSPDNSTIYMSPSPYIQTPSDWLFLIDPATGLTTGTLILSGFPSFIDEYGDEQVTDAASALGFVGSTLYASFSKGGYRLRPGILGTIDLNTGKITEIGEMTGMNGPTGGLEYVGGTMYAVSAGQGPSSLYTINLDTGAATEVAPITLNGNQIRGVTALAFADGKMYTVCMDRVNLYSVDLITGELTEEFYLGYDLNSLTTQKKPSQLNVDLSLWSLRIKNFKKWDWTTISMWGTFDLPDLNLNHGDTVESRVTIELIGVLPNGGNLVISNDPTLKVKDRKKILIIRKKN